MFCPDKKAEQDEKKLKGKTDEKGGRLTRMINPMERYVINIGPGITLLKV